VDQVWKLDAADEMCPKCGGGLREMKDQFEEAEEIDIVQRQFVMVKHKRQKYRCSCNACVETATGPVKLRAGSRYSVDFAVEVAVSKYLDHLPLERQSRIMRREGLAVQSSTLWDQLDALAQVLSPAHERLHDSVLEQPVIGADETFWRLMDKRGRNKGVAKRWQAWTICAPRAVVYRIQDSRSTQAAADILRDYDGIVIADGYTAYESLVKRGGRFTLANCWAHARRKYVEVEKFYPTEVAEILDLIGELYGIERVCSTGPPGAEQLELRRTLRDERSRAVIKRIECWALDQRALPQSGLGRGIGYMSGLWKGLTRFLDDPRIPLDNNATERSLRGMVVGRKNHYGSKSRRGTEVAALFYSLLESAKLADVEPKLYLRTATAAALGGDTIPLPHEIS